MSVNVKICGMREAGNISRIAELRPDYMGFIFYPKSPRYVGAGFHPVWGPEMAGIRKVAVFVDEPLDSAMQILNEGRFEAAQLHGSESPEYCGQIREKGWEVIKSFGIGEDFDFGVLTPYVPYVDRFLFDAKTSAYGGSGKTFGWEKLTDYPFQVPFFLSGGLDMENLEPALRLTGGLPLDTLDLNSRFEMTPAVKNIDLVAEAISLIRQ